MTTGRPIAGPGPRASLALAAVVFLGMASAARGAFQIDATYFGPGAQVITFENPNGDTGLPTIPGITFNQSGAGAGVGPAGDATFNGTFLLGGSKYVTFFDKQHYGNFSGPAGYSSLEIDFATPVTAVGAYDQQVNLTTAAATSITMLVYGTSNNLLGSVTTFGLPSVYSSPIFVGLADPSGISRVVWEPGDGSKTAQGDFSGGFIGVDNVTFNAVPEPASIATLAAGLVGMATWRLRRRNRA